MFRRKRHSAARAAMVAALSAAALATTSVSASAYVPSDLVDFNLTESTSFYGSQYSISTGTDKVVSYRWLDAPSKQTIIGANDCTDLSNLGFASYAINSTGYQSLFTGTFTSQCFVIRGRTVAGSGSMTYYDGRVQR